MAATFLKSLQALENADNKPTARWEVPLNDGVHVIEFEHGTATGRRIVRIDGKTVVNREWMFRLVGDENIQLNDHKLVIKVEPIPGLKYAYTLWVDGKSLDKFIQSQSKVLKSWTTQVGQTEYRIILDKNSQTVWINGEQAQVSCGFTDHGSALKFVVAELPAVIVCTSSGNKIIGMVYKLFVDNNEILEMDLKPSDVEVMIN